MLPFINMLCSFAVHCQCLDISISIPWNFRACWNGIRFVQRFSEIDANTAHVNKYVTLSTILKNIPQRNLVIIRMIKLVLSFISITRLLIKRSSIALLSELSRNFPYENNFLNFYLGVDWNNDNIHSTHENTRPTRVDR